MVPRKGVQIWRLVVSLGEQSVIQKAKSCIRYLGHNKEFKQLCGRVHDFIDYFVELAMKHELKEKSGSAEKKEKYVFLEALAEQIQDPIELRSQILNILLAGRDTTASLLGWTFWLLAKNPAIYTKLRQTILEEFGTYKQPKEITFSGLKGCQYLQWVLNESLRLHPVVPLNSRQAVRDTTLPVGGGPDGKAPVFVSKGTEVMYSVSFCCRSPTRNRQLITPKRFTPCTTAKTCGARTLTSSAPTAGAAAAPAGSTCHSTAARASASASSSLSQRPAT